MIVPISILIPFRFSQSSTLELWVQNRVSKDKLSSLLEFPGGKVEKGEIPKQACIREVLEETGVKVNEGDVKLLEPHFFEQDDITLNIYTFIYEDKSGQFTSEGYQPAKSLLKDKSKILPNNEHIILETLKYFQTFRA